jgi:signal transduction histidine kinase
MEKRFPVGVPGFFTLGTNELVDTELSRKIILSNKLAALIFVIASPYFFFFQKISFSFAVMVLPLLVLFASVPLLNWRGHNVSARMLLLVTACCGAFFYADSLGRDAGIQFLYFAFLGMPLVLFSLREKFFLYISLFVPVLCFFLLEFYNYTLFSDVFISSSYLKFIYSTALIFVSLLIVFYLRFYISEIESSHTSLQTAYEDLQLQQNLLEKSWHDSVYAQLTRTIAHELKNPLFEFGMVIGALEKSLDDRETAMMFISSLATTIEELMQLVNAMLESGGASVGEYKEIRISEVMNRVLILAEGSIKKRNIQLTKDIADVPPIMGDSKAFLMIFSNLIVNAMEAMEDGSTAALTVRVMVDPSPQSGRQGVVVEISDTGVGIPKSRQEGLFKGGQSTKGIEERQRGIGLGLVWKLIDQMGGEITVHSDPDVRPGTMFRIVV